jgi:hypothetical protein
MSNKISEISEIMKILFELVKCSNKNCSQQKKKINANKKTKDLYDKYNSEQNFKIKLKLANEISKNNIIYEYDKCVVKHCNNIFNDFIKILKIIAVSKIPPENSEKLKQFNKIVIELETLFSTSNLTKEKYETYAKNITELMESVK